MNRANATDRFLEERCDIDSGFVDELSRGVIACCHQSFYRGTYTEPAGAEAPRGFNDAHEDAGRESRRSCQSIGNGGQFVKSRSPGSAEHGRDSYHVGRGHGGWRWRAYVDGEEVELVCANSRFRAVPIPDGALTVDLGHHPPMLRHGWVMSGFHGGDSYPDARLGDAAVCLRWCCSSRIILRSSRAVRMLPRMASEPTPGSRSAAAG